MVFLSPPSVAGDPVPTKSGCEGGEGIRQGECMSGPVSTAAAPPRQPVMRSLGNSLGAALAGHTVLRCAFTLALVGIRRASVRPDTVIPRQLKSRVSSAAVSFTE